MEKEMVSAGEVILHSYIGEHIAPNCAKIISCLIGSLRFTLLHVAIRCTIPFVKHIFKSASQVFDFITIFYQQIFYNA